MRAAAVFIYEHRHALLVVHQATILIMASSNQVEFSAEDFHNGKIRALPLCDTPLTIYQHCLHWMLK